MKPGFGILIFSGLNQLSFSQPEVWIYLASYKFRPQVVCPENLNNKLLFIVLHKLKTFLFCWIKTIHCSSFSPVYDFYDQTLNSPTFIFAVIRINEVGYIHRLQIVTISFIMPFLYWGHLGFFFYWNVGAIHSNSTMDSVSSFMLFGSRKKRFTFWPERMPCLWGTVGLNRKEWWPFLWHGEMKVLPLLFAQVASMEPGLEWDPRLGIWCPCTKLCYYTCYHIAFIYFPQSVSIYLTICT